MNMVLSIYQCDICGEDCSEWANRIHCNFPLGEVKHICLKCAKEIFKIEDKENGDNKNV